MTALSGPAWRLAGAIVSWLLFAFCFTVLLQSTSVLAGLGGFCASGGPYVIATQCTGTIMLFAPLGIIGICVAGAIALYFARGFAAPLIVWGWPVLFVGLGIQFAISAFQPGGITFGVLAVLFILMGLAPLVFELRAGPRRIILGKTNLRDQRFREREGAPRTFYAFGRDDPAAAVDATPGDWLASLGVWICSVVSGTFLGLLVFAAVAAGAAA